MCCYPVNTSFKNTDIFPFSCFTSKKFALLRKNFKYFRKSIADSKNCSTFAVY